MKIIAKFAKVALIGFTGMAGVAALTSCKDKDFKVQGNVEGGADKSIVLEKPDFHGRWIAVDSARISSGGAFSINAPRPSSPEIYRLAMDDRYIYLPVDSTETLTVSSKASDFGVDFSVSGTLQAEKMAEFEKELMALDFNDSIKKDEFKRKVYSKYLKDAQGGIISYYVLTKIVGDAPLYDVTDDNDTKYYAAVATAFEQYRPTDPHAGMLRQASLEGLKRRNMNNGKRRVVEAEEIKLIDIELPDENGKNVKLSETVGHGKRGVMIVSLMNVKESPAINKALSDIHSAKGDVAFYMVSLDPDQYAWRDAARNLPWVTVSDPDGRNSNIITKYNIGAMPAFFIFDGNGDLIDRAFSVEELNKKL